MCACSGPATANRRFQPPAPPWPWGDSWRWAAAGGVWVVHRYPDPWWVALPYTIGGIDAAWRLVALGQLARIMRSDRLLHQAVALIRCGSRFGSEGQRESERSPVARVRLHRDPAMMCVDHGSEDRRAHPGTACPPAPCPVGAVEPLEHVLLLLVGQAATLVGDLEDDSRIAVLALRWPAASCRRLRRARVGPLPVAQRPRADRDVDRRSLRRVGQSVAQQVANHLAQPDLVAGPQRCVRSADGEVDGTLRRNDPGVVEGVRSDREQVYGLEVERALLVKAGKQEHVIDQHAHPHRLALDPLDEPVKVRAGERPGWKSSWRPGVGAVGRRPRTRRGWGTRRRRVS